MWSRKSRVKAGFSPAKIRVVMPRSAMTTVFDECDHFTEDETGGRVIGTYHEDNGVLTISVCGIIEPGPAARRSRVSFFQDGAYQESVFRRVEEKHPEIEHLGNWHTHHVNGFPQLSGGDIETYTRIVNHKNHNTAFFYALLVTAKNRGADGLSRYDFKHYVFKRGIDGFCEVPAKNVQITDDPLVWPVGSAPRYPPSAAGNDEEEWPGRVKDRDVLEELFGGFRSYSSQQLGFYWRGKLEAADGSEHEILVLEDKDAQPPVYRAVLRDPSDGFEKVAETIGQEDHPSARRALVAAERSLNRALFKGVWRARK